MAKQKITVESRLRTQNTLYQEQITELGIENHQMRRDLEQRDSMISVLQADLARTNRDLLWTEEQLDHFRIAAAANARLLVDKTMDEERLRFPATGVAK